MIQWQIYPAIDLRQGRVVRLRQGDPDRETAYEGDPLAVAHRWQEAGALWLHVINLDGAFGEGGQENLDAVKRLARTGMRIQFGGGLRDLEEIRALLALGVHRAILGTAAVEDPALVEEAVDALGPDSIAVAIDSSRGRVRTHGWRRASTLSDVQIAHRCARQGVEWLIHTDVGRDGMGSGLNVGASTHLVRATRSLGIRDAGLRVIASGGVADLGDVKRAYRAGLSGVIIGRALYEGLIRLEDALAVGSTGDVG